MGDLVVRDRVALALWRFACPPKLRDEWATDPPPPVFVRMADAVVAELAAIRAESPAAVAMADYLRGVEVMDRAGFLARYGQGDAERVPSPSEESLRAAGAFMAAMEAEERWRSSLPPVGSAVEWASGGGAPIGLVVVEGPSAGAVVALDRPSLVIGRAEGCDVRLADELVSPRHARLSCEASDGRWPAGRWVIEDLGSVNGVFVGGTRAFVGLPVSAGVRVQVGGSVFVLR